ncbi:MAG: hypothetical protein ABI310_03025 [Microbacteriaceae bacterium]
MRLNLPRVLGIPVDDFAHTAVQLGARAAERADALKFLVGCLPDPRALPAKLVPPSRLSSGTFCSWQTLIASTPASIVCGTTTAIGTCR